MSMEANRQAGHTELADVDLKHMHRKLLRSVESLRKQDAGNYPGEPDRPSKLFTSVLYDVVRAPVRDREHLNTLFAAIDYLMTDGSGPSSATIEQAIDDILLETIRVAEPREQALLALVRYRMSGPRRELLNA